MSKDAKLPPCVAWGRLVLGGFAAAAGAFAYAFPKSKDANAICIIVTCSGLVIAAWGFFSTLFNKRSTRRDVRIAWAIMAVAVILTGIGIDRNRDKFPIPFLRMELVIAIVCAEIAAIVAAIYGYLFRKSKRPESQLWFTALILFVVTLLLVYKPVRMPMMSLYLSCFWGDPTRPFTKDPEESARTLMKMPDSVLTWAFKNTLSSSDPNKRLLAISAINFASYTDAKLHRSEPNYQRAMLPAKDLVEMCLNDKDRRIQAFAYMMLSRVDRAEFLRISKEFADNPKSRPKWLKNALTQLYGDGVGTSLRKETLRLSFDYDIQLSGEIWSPRYQSALAGLSKVPITLYLAAFENSDDKIRRAAYDHLWRKCAEFPPHFDCIHFFQSDQPQCSDAIISDFRGKLLQLLSNKPD